MPRASRTSCGSDAAARGPPGTKRYWGSSPGPSVNASARMSLPSIRARTSTFAPLWAGSGTTTRRVRQRFSSVTGRLSNAPGPGVAPILTTDLTGGDEVLGSRCDVAAPVPLRPLYPAGAARQERQQGAADRRAADRRPPVHWDPGECHDTYEERVRKLVAAKRKVWTSSANRSPRRRRTSSTSWRRSAGASSRAGPGAADRVTGSLPAARRRRRGGRTPKTRRPCRRRSCGNGRVRRACRAGRGRHGISSSRPLPGKPLDRPRAGFGPATSHSCPVRRVSDPTPPPLVPVRDPPGAGRRSARRVRS